VITTIVSLSTSIRSIQRVLPSSSNRPATKIAATVSHISVTSSPPSIFLCRYGRRYTAYEERVRRRHFFETCVIKLMSRAFSFTHDEPALLLQAISMRLPRLCQHIRSNMFLYRYGRQFTARRWGTIIMFAAQ
jgi:hypothetical protein